MNGSLRALPALTLLLLSAGCDSSPTEATPPADVEPELPSTLAGAPLVVTELSGAGLADPADDAWRDALSALGVSASDLKLVVATPRDATLDLEMSALQIPGWTWAARVQSFTEGLRASSGGAVRFERREVGGKSVLRGTHTGSPAMPPAYYYPAGYVLFLVRTGSDALAADALRILPAGPGMASGSVSAALVAGGAGTLASGTILLTVPALPALPTCVGYPPGLDQIITVQTLTATSDGIFPDPFVTVSAFAPFGSLLPPVSGGTVHSFAYQSRQYGLGAGERLRLIASSPAGGAGAGEWPLRVQHCANGLWQDGPRLLRIDHVMDAVEATIHEGELSCGETGVAFSGSVSRAAVTTTLSGDDLKVCNPPACVEAGLLPKTDLRSWSAAISDESRAIDFVWERQLFDIEYDDEGHATSCAPSEVEQASFSIGRLTFGPERPF